MEENKSIKKIPVSAALDKLYLIELVVGAPLLTIFGIAGLTGLLDLVPAPIAAIGLVLFVIGLSLTADSLLIFLSRLQDKKKDTDKCIAIYEDTLDVEIHTINNAESATIPFHSLVRVSKGQFVYGNYLGMLVGAKRNVGFVKITYTDASGKSAFKNFGPIDNRLEFITEMNRQIKERAD